MGGKGSGGRRVGAGRKPKDRLLRMLDGGAAKRSAVPTTNPNTTTVAPIEEFDAPDDLDRDERAVWLKLAPHAFKARTLTAATALSFEMLCRNITLERALHESPADRGGSNHRGLIQRVDAELLRFNLSPGGKPMYDAPREDAKPANPLARFLKRAK